jgi:hypothetical protein
MLGCVPQAHFTHLIIYRMRNTQCKQNKDAPTPRLFTYFYNQGRKPVSPLNRKRLSKTGRLFYKNRCIEKVIVNFIMNELL